MLIAIEDSAKEYILRKSEELAMLLALVTGHRLLG